MGNSTWKDFVGLFDGLQKLFGLQGSMADYDFIIANRRVDFNSKNDFIEFIENNKNSSSNPVKILDAKGMYDTIIIC